MSHFLSRRGFLFSSLSAPMALFFGFSRNLFADDKPTVKSSAADAKAGLVDVKRAETPQTRQSDTIARAVRYVPKTANPKQKCSTCMQFKWAVDSSDKEIQLDIPGAGKQSVGTCQLFSGGFVAADGYCMSWLARK